MHNDFLGRFGQSEGNIVAAAAWSVDTSFIWQRTTGTRQLLDVRPRENLSMLSLHTAPLSVTSHSSCTEAVCLSQVLLDEDLALTVRKHMLSTKTALLTVYKGFTLGR